MPIQNDSFRGSGLTFWPDMEYLPLLIVKSQDLLGVVCSLIFGKDDPGVAALPGGP